MRKKIEKVIVEKSRIPHTNGYVLNNRDNLINGVDLNLFQNDLIQGNGNELVNKFKALFSSSALVVNNFAIVKKHKNIFTFLGYSGFTDASFERQFITGLKGTPPNLDFVIENDEVIIAFESKYLELLNQKKAKFKSSYNKDNLIYLGNFWFDLMNKYNERKLNLDVAQLIKHSIGLTNYRLNFSNSKNKKVILIYIYWTPNNLANFEVYNKHSEEIRKFSKLLSEQTDIEFKTMSYNEFWEIFTETSIFKDHFDKLKSRYSIDT